MTELLVLEKSSRERRYTLGVVYEPDVEDTQGEFAKAEDIELAAWDYMSRLQHLAKAGAGLIASALGAEEDNPVQMELTEDLENLVTDLSKSALDDQHLQVDDHLGTVVESYVAPADFVLGKQVVKKGTWLLGVVWTEEMFDKIKKGERTGFSMFGRARRVKE